VRQLARELGVALETLAGTGPGGAITADDVRRAAATGGPAPGSGPQAAPASSSGPSPAAGAEERIPLRGLRRKIAEHMRRSLDTAAHFTFVAECDMTAVVQHREWLLPRARQAGVSLTFLAYVVKALIEPLKKYPVLNASLDDEKSEVVLKRYVHVGIATETEDGLTVPVIHDADRRPLLEIAGEIQRLASAARKGKLKLEELQNGTFTVTSTGARGGLLATPILYHPQVAILGVHEVKKRPAVVDGQIVARDMTNLSLSLDHRVVDGAVGAEFLYAVIARLQQPEAWLSPEAIG
jgi:pyruvate dehydrogenase E2 component (dihydrolipoamide acetyltransferase)